MSLLWDSLDPFVAGSGGWVARGARVRTVSVVERWEEPLFRERFQRTPRRSVNLDWPPRFDIVRQVRIFRPADRELYLRGGKVPTEYILR